MATLTIKPTAAGNDVQIKSGDGNTTHATFGDTSTVNMSAGTISGGSIASAVTFPAGHVINTQQAVYRGMDSSDSSSGYVQIGAGEHDVLEVVTATPKSTSSKFLLIVHIGGVSQSGNAEGSIAFQLRKGGSFITGSGSDTITGIQTASSWKYYMGNDSNHAGSSSFAYLDSPASASALTYSVYFWAQDTRTATINYAHGNYNAATSYGTHTASTLTVLEIEG